MGKRKPVSRGGFAGGSRTVRNDTLKVPTWTPFGQEACGIADNKEGKFETAVLEVGWHKA
jgi:hypothetical protein